MAVDDLDRLRLRRRRRREDHGGEEVDGPPLKSAQCAIIHFRLAVDDT